MAEENKTKNRIRVWIWVLVGVVVVVVTLVVMIIVANNLSGEENDTESDEVASIGSSAIERCGAITQAYKSGVISKTEANNIYMTAMQNTTDNHYKVYLTICYADDLFKNGASLEESASLVKSIYQYIDNEDDRDSYYNALGYFYENSGSTEDDEYYVRLREELLSAGYEIENDEIENDEIVYEEVEDEDR